MLTSWCQAKGGKREKIKLDNLKCGQVKVWSLSWLHSSKMRAEFGIYKLRAGKVSVTGQNLINPTACKEPPVPQGARYPQRQLHWIIIFQSVSFHELDSPSLVEKGEKICKLIPIHFLSQKLIGTFHTHYNGYYKNKQTKQNKFWWECGETENHVHCWWECKIVQPLWKTKWVFLKNLSNSTPRYIPKRMKDSYIISNIFLYMPVHRGIIHSGPKVETTQVSMQD